LRTHEESRLGPEKKRETTRTGYQAWVPGMEGEKKKGGGRLDNSGGGASGAKMGQGHQGLLKKSGSGKIVGGSIAEVYIQGRDKEGQKRPPSKGRDVGLGLIEQRAGGNK